MAHEYILENVSQRELNILEKNSIDWYPDSMDSNDICFESEEDCNKAIAILGR